LGSIATSAIRGASAGHTVVVWNGLALQSPMLGLLDLSMLPSGLVDEVSIQYGGQSTLWGSGAIGGVIHLNNQAKFGKKFGIDIFSRALVVLAPFNNKLFLKKAIKNGPVQLACLIKKRRMILNIVFDPICPNASRHMQDLSNEDCCKS